MEETKVLLKKFISKQWTRFNKTDHLVLHCSRHDLGIFSNCKLLALSYAISLENMSLACLNRFVRSQI